MLEKGHHCHDNEDIDNGVIVEKFPENFSAEVFEMGLAKPADAVAVEAKTDEIVLDVPNQNRQKANEGKENRQV